MDWPPIIALIITYKRLPLALATIRSVKQFVEYPNIGFHIADDGSGEEYIEALCKEIGGSYSITSTDAARSGVGANMNRGIESCLKRADFWLHLEDDWVLTKPLDLHPCVQLMMEDESVGMIRLGRLTAGLDGVVFPGAQRLWWRLRSGVETYTFSGNASLRHRRFHDAYGLYKEGLMPGRTELYYCGLFNEKEGPDIVWPAWVNDGDVFQHIGDHQSYKWWQETGGLTADQAAVKFEEMDRDEVAVALH